MVAKDLKDFIISNGGIYYRGSDGVLARALCLTETREELHRIHHLSCGENDINLYRCL